MMEDIKERHEYNEDPLDKKIYIYINLNLLISQKSGVVLPSNVKYPLVAAPNKWPPRAAPRLWFHTFNTQPLLLILSCNTHTFRRCCIKLGGNRGRHPRALHISLLCVCVLTCDSSPLSHLGRCIFIVKTSGWRGRATGLCHKSPTHPLNK